MPCWAKPASVTYATLGWPSSQDNSLSLRTGLLPRRSSWLDYYLGLGFPRQYRRLIWVWEVVCQTSPPNFTPISSWRHHVPHCLAYPCRIAILAVRYIVEYLCGIRDRYKKIVYYAAYEMGQMGNRHLGLVCWVCATTLAAPPLNMHYWTKGTTKYLQ